MGECKPGNDEDGACVRWVAYIAIETGGDKAVFGVYRQVKGEELAQSTKTVQTDIGAKHYGEDADNEKWRDADRRGLCEWTDERICGDGEG